MEGISNPDDEEVKIEINSNMVVQLLDKKNLVTVQV
jgi:hypothetical protein